MTAGTKLKVSTLFTFPHTVCMTRSIHQFSSFPGVEKTQSMSNSKGDTTL